MGILAQGSITKQTAGEQSNVKAGYKTNSNN
jgi:hypothetical protein